MRASWWKWQPKMSRELGKRYPDFTDPTSWRLGSSMGKEARCQGPKCDARYRVHKRDHYYCSARCANAAAAHFEEHGALPKAPIMLKDLLSYVRPRDEYKAEAARLREEAEVWKQERLRGQNG